jgi:hypothetical protein
MGRGAKEATVPPFTVTWTVWSCSGGPSVGEMECTRQAHQTTHWYREGESNDASD